MTQPLLGGILIGLAATLLLALNGRIAGISGILSSAMTSQGFERTWRLFFLTGLLGGGVAMALLMPEGFLNASGRTPFMIAVAGLLVGFGTRMSGGCTSGHGVCGLSRLSIRSLVATVTFMTFGFLTVFLVRWMTGGLR